jgi:hypothetical protein
MDREIRRWVKTCEPCQRAKVHRHTALLLAPFPPPPSGVSDIYIWTSSAHYRLRTTSSICLLASIVLRVGRRRGLSITCVRTPSPPRW